jgi:hypothetical protein
LVVGCHFVRRLIYPLLLGVIQVDVFEDFVAGDEQCIHVVGLLCGRDSGVDQGGV